MTKTVWFNVLLCSAFHFYSFFFMKLLIAVTVCDILKQFFVCVYVYRVNFLCVCPGLNHTCAEFYPNFGIPPYVINDRELSMMICPMCWASESPTVIFILLCSSDYYNNNNNMNVRSNVLGKWIALVIKLFTKSETTQLLILVAKNAVVAESRNKVFRRCIML